MKHLVAAVCVAVALAGAVGCGDRLQPTVTRVLIISIDGLRPDLLLRGHSPVISGLMRRGSYSLLARTVTEGYTVPSHVSMLTGVVPARHGVTWDHHVEDSYPNVPTLFELARRSGYTTAVVTGKTKLIVLTKPGTLDWSHIGHEAREDDAAVAARAAEWWRSNGPDVMFTHLGGVDIAGHASGWGSSEQMLILEQADRAVGMLLEAVAQSRAASSTLILLTADHGGAGLLHSPDEPLSQRIPWIAAGPLVKKNFDLGTVPGLAIDTMATFATACATLGIAMPEPRDGRAVLEIFETPPLVVMR